MYKKNSDMLLFFIGFFFAINSLFFIAIEVEQMGLFFILNLKSVYALYLVLVLIFAYLIFLRRKNLNLNLFKKLLIMFLPTVLIWVYGFIESIHFNYFFKFLADLYFIGVCFYFLFIIQKYEKISDFLNEFGSLKKINFANLFKFKKNIVIFIVLLVFVINLSFGLFHLSKYAAVDEALWTGGRITKFWSNIQDREWEKTRVSDKPGITVAILSGAGLNWVDPKDDKYNNYNFVEKRNFVFRFPILLFSSLMLFVFFFALKRLFGRTVSMVSVILIGLSPLLIGISTIINPDAILWIFTSISIIFYFLYIKDKKNKDLYLSGVFLGLSLLTKYVANILYIFFLVLIFLNFLFNREKNASVREYFKKSFFDYIILVFFSLLTFFVLLPAAWVEPIKIFESTILSQAFEKFLPLFLIILFFIILDMVVLKNKIISFVFEYISKFNNLIFKFIVAAFSLISIFIITNVYFGTKWLDVEKILASPKTSFEFSNTLQLFLANFHSLLFGITPIVLLGMAYFLFKSLKNKEVKKEFYYIFYLLIFIILYYLGSSFNEVSATVRYQIILYPLASIIAAFGLTEFYKNCDILEKYKKITLTLLIVVSAFSVYMIKPFYFSYANFLLPKKYVLNLKDMGDGSYEAAQYLNSLPRAKDLTIWTDKRGVCQFFVGEKCHSTFSFEQKELNSFDFVVVTSGRESRTTNMILNRFYGVSVKTPRIDKIYKEEDFDFKLEIGGRPNNFIKVVSGDKLKK